MIEIDAQVAQIELCDRTITNLDGRALARNLVVCLYLLAHDRNSATSPQRAATQQHGSDWKFNNGRPG
jgi:hypothetical protein